MSPVSWLWRLLLAALPFATWGLIQMPGRLPGGGALRAPHDWCEVRPGAIAVGSLIPEAKIAAVLTLQVAPNDKALVDVTRWMEARESAAEQGCAWVRWSGGRFLLLQGWLVGLLLSPLAFPLARALLRDHARPSFDPSLLSPVAWPRNRLIRMGASAARFPVHLIVALFCLRRRPLALVVGLLGLPLTWLVFQGLASQRLHPLGRVPLTDLRVFVCGGYVVISPPEQFWRSTPNETLCHHDAWPPKRRICYYTAFGTHWRDRAEIENLEAALVAPASAASVFRTASGRTVSAMSIQFVWGTASVPWRGTTATLISTWYAVPPALLLCGIFSRAFRQQWFRRGRIRANCCPNCAYPRFGLPEPRCPECGAALAGDDSHTRHALIPTTSPSLAKST
jgi:hypothetical protein